jgi:mannitol-1-phosphate/altronate dehydrogenase
MFTTLQNVSTEPIQVRVLNASHSALAYPALLAGYRTVQEAMQDNHVNSYVRTFVTTATKISGLSSQPVAVDNLLQQLSTAIETGSLSQLCGDGASKLASYVLPVLQERLRNGKDVSSLAFLLAAYGHYLQHGADDTGEPYAINEPRLSDEDWLKLTDGDSMACLAISPFASAQLLSYPKFVAQYKAYRNQIACYGLVFSLKQTLCAFREVETETGGLATA